MIKYLTQKPSSPGGRTTSSPESQTGKPSRNRLLQNRARQNTESEQNHIIGTFSQDTHLRMNLKRTKWRKINGRCKTVNKMLTVNKMTLMRNLGNRAEVDNDYENNVDNHDTDEKPVEWW